MNDYTLKNYSEMSELTSRMAMVFEWDKWLKEIPSIEIPPNCRIRVIPPFGGAVVRFCVISEFGSVSVYLDCYEKLGCWEIPYWEIYPSADDDVERFAMEKTTELYDGIVRAINHMKPKDIL